MYNLLALFFCAFFIGCGPAVAPNTSFDSVASNNHIVYLRKDGQFATLNHYLKVVESLSKKNSNDLLTVIAVINNQRDQGNNEGSLICDIQVIFYDQHGIQLEQTNWQPVYFPPGKDVTIKRVAMNRRACDYELYLRNPRVTR